MVLFLVPLKSRQHIDGFKNIKNKILIVSYDTRAESELVKLHNRNIECYVSKNKVDYKFFTECTSSVKHIHNPYWCKIFLVAEYLPDYEYVLWLDTDTLILEQETDFKKLFDSFPLSDFFIGVDKNSDTLNAGVFCIKNSERGVQFLKQLTEIYINNEYEDLCIDKETSKLNGLWAGYCYEQGIMNYLMKNKIYSPFVKIFDGSVFFNSHRKPKSVVPIMHLYGPRIEDKIETFKKIEKKKPKLFE